MGALTASPGRIRKFALPFGVAGTALAAGLLLLDPAPLDWLEAMT